MEISTEIADLTDIPAFEFTKSFVKSALNEFEDLEGTGIIGKAITEGADLLAETLCPLPSCGAEAIRMSASLVKPIQNLIKAKNKMLAISVVNSKSSELFLSTFCDLFVEVGVGIYYTYEFQLNRICLKVGSKSSLSSSTADDDKLEKGNRSQAIHILATYAGSVCFHYMLETESKQELLQALMDTHYRAKVSSKLKSFLLEKLYYVKDASHEILPKKKYISAYDFFVRCIPLYIKKDLSFKAVTPQSIPSNSYYGDFYIPKDQKLKNIIYKIRRPTLFEIQTIQLDHLASVETKCLPNIEPYSFICKNSIFMCIHVNAIQTRLYRDKTFMWNETVLEEIKIILKELSRQSKLVATIDEKITNVQQDIVDSKHLAQENLNALKEQTRTILDTIRTRLSSSTGTEQIYFNIKRPTASFTGREKYLYSIHSECQKSLNEQNRLTVLSQVITGLGGIGKTETVRMYIHEYGKHYNHVVWIDAEDHSTAEDCFRKLGKEKLKLPFQDNENKPLDFPSILEDIYKSLCQNNTLLIIFDNAESLDSPKCHRDGIRRFLPHAMPQSWVKPAILVTSRNQDWKTENIISLDVWTPEECIEFTLKELKQDITETNKDLASKMGYLFGFFPLAIQSAVAVIRKQSRRSSLVGLRYGIQNLMEDYESGNRKVLKKTDDFQSKTMLVIWKVTLDKIKLHKHGELAHTVLNTMAYLSPTNIPSELLQNLFVPKNYQKELNALQKALLLLTDYSLIKLCGSHFTIHRMIQDVTIEHLRRQSKTNQCQENTSWTQNISDDQVLIWLIGKLKLYLSTQFCRNNDSIVANLVHVANHLLCHLEVPEFLEFTELVANKTMEIQTRLSITELYFTNLIAHSTESLGKTHETTQRYRLSLVETLRLKGKHNDASKGCEEILSEQRVSCSPSDPLLLLTKHSFAMVLLSQGKFDDAFHIFQEVYKNWLINLGPCNKDTLTAKNNMGIALFLNKEYEQAFPIYREVLEARESVLGPHDRETLKTKHNTAVLVYLYQQNPEKALEMYLEVLNAQEEKFGAEDPDTLKTKRNIAILRACENKPKEALQIYSEVVEVEERVLGHSHPRTVKTRSWIESLKIVCNHGNETPIVPQRHSYDQPTIPIRKRSSALRLSVLLLARSVSIHC